MTEPSSITRSEEPGARSEDAPAIDETATLRSGSHLGRYVVLFRVGGGGMGVIYAAYDPQLDRKVALKVVRPKKRGRSRSRAHRRLLREAQALAKLSHPNVVAIHDVGVIEGTPATTVDGEPMLFVAMDFVEGHTLRRWLQAKRRAPEAILEKFLQAADGLSAAHAAGVVHRDFKPDNAIVDQGGRVQVLDFGLARLEQPTQPTDAPGAQPGVDPPPLTIQPSRIGTPGYMAPEQHLGESATPAADQFAFCVSLYEALYRKAPFVGDDPTMLAENVIHGRMATAPRHAKVSLKLRRVLLRGLAVRPDDRFASMRQLVEALRGTPRRVRKRVLAYGGAAGLVTGAALIYAGSVADRPDPCPGAEARLDGVWDAEVQGAIADVFAGAGRPHAEETAQRVTAALDAYAETWLEAHEEICEATHVRHEQSDALLDRRMRCLSDRLDAAAALVSVLAQADGPVVDRALRAIDGLPAVNECRRVEATRVGDAPPSDEATQERLEAQRRRLAQVEALLSSGKPAEATELAAAVVERVRDLDAPALFARALLAHGLALRDAAKLEPAATRLREAALQAERTGDDLLTARIRVALVGTLGDRLSRFDEGRLWADLARAGLDKLRNQTTPAVELEAQLEHNLALVSDKDARPEDALSHERKAIALLRASQGSSELVLAAYESQLAMTLGQLGRTHEALKRARDSKATWERLLGPDHPRAAVAESALGVIYDYEGDYAEALRHYETAHAMAVHAKGKDSDLADEILSNLAIVAVRLGDTDRALRAFGDIVEQQTAVHGPRSAQVASALHNLGATERMAGKLDDALAHHERALAIREALFGSDDAQVVGSITGIANVLETRGDNAEALALRRRALAIETARYGEDHVELVTGLSNLAHNEMLVGELDAALRTAERALRIASRNEVPQDSRAYTRVVLARVLAERGENPDRVQALVQRAKTELGDLPASASRRLIAQIEDAPGADVGPRAAKPDHTGPR